MRSKFLSATACLRLRTSLPVVLLVTAAFLTGCAGEVAPEAETVNAAPIETRTVVPAASLLDELRIGTPRLTAVTGQLQVEGRVEADETRQARISSPVAGRITDLEVVEGQSVKRGDLIAVIRSTELAESQLDFLKAHSQRDLAAKSVERAKLLVDAGVIGSAELQRRESELLQAQAEYSSERDQLRVLGMSDERVTELLRTRHVNAVTEIFATISGTIMQRPVTPGQVVQPAEDICVIADLSNVWLIADVPEQSAGQLVAGKLMEAQIAALPDRRIAGKLSFVSAIVNPETRTIRARVDLPNPDGLYKPAMLASMTLQDLAETQLVIPSSAIVRENNEDFVFLQIRPGAFLLHRVRLGGEFGAVRVVESGLEPEDQLVLDGAFHLNNERKQQSLQGSAS
jgi:membrane fusion protein, heavy metal efflux system